MKYLFLLSFLLLTLAVFPHQVLARGGCFAAGTQILTPSGERPIQSLKNGDKLISYNFHTNKREVGIIGRIDVYIEPVYFIINHKTKVTPTHPFYVQTGGSYRLVEVSDLKLGDILLSEALTPTKISSIDTLRENITVYNLVNVGPDNNYFANGFLVHNKGGGGGGGGIGGGGHYYGGHSYSSCLQIPDARARADCEQQSAVTLWTMLGVGAAIIAGSLASVFYKRRKYSSPSNRFSTDEGLISFAKALVPSFSNKYSLNYSQDTEVWRPLSPRGSVDQSQYSSFISRGELESKVRDLFLKYQSDWANKRFGEMKSYVKEPYYSKQLRVFGEDFGESFDAVYQPTVLSASPLSVKQTPEGMEFKIQVNGSMIDFEITLGGEVSSGEPYKREFSEFWSILVDRNKKMYLMGISQSDSIINTPAKLIGLVVGLGLIAVMVILFLIASSSPSRTYIPPLPINISSPPAQPNPINATPSAIYNPPPNLSGSEILNSLNQFRRSNKLSVWTTSDELCHLAEKRADFLIVNNGEATKASRDQYAKAFNSQVSSYSGAGPYEIFVADSGSDQEIVNYLKTTPDYRTTLTSTTAQGIPLAKGCIATRVEGQNSLMVLELGDK